MGLLKKINDFLRTSLFHRREGDSPCKRIGYIINQLDIIMNMCQKYRLTSATISLKIPSEEELIEIKNELNKRENLSFELKKENNFLKIKIFEKRNSF